VKILNLFVFVWLIFLAACATPPTLETTIRPTVTTEPIVADETEIPSSLPPCTQISQTWTSPVDNAVLVCVPAGEFLMGADEDDPLAEDREKPQRQVYLDAYWIDQTEISNRQYAQCQSEGGCVRDMRSGDSSLTRTDYLGNPAYNTYPTLIYLSQDAEEYCTWAGRRLPTEAEWEKAARGPDGRLYPWGNAELDCEYANFGDCLGDTTAATSHPEGASPYGAFHMTGNVWEWVADWYDPNYYAGAPDRNPQGPPTGDYRVRRGGGWRSLDAHLRVTNRASGAPRHYFDGQMGFRCAVSAAPGW